MWRGHTGLTVTIGAIATLFVLMQATGKVNWSDVVKRPSPPAHLPPPAAPTGPPVPPAGGDRKAQA